jgi:hypothetical protein
MAEKLPGGQHVPEMKLVKWALGARRRSHGGAQAMFARVIIRRATLNASKYIRAH